MAASGVPDTKPTVLERILRLFADVRGGEGTTAIIMLFNIFLVLVAYYVIKTVRESLILAVGGEELKGSELKAYATACQALLLIFVVPLYSYFAARVPTRKLIFGVGVFFIICLELFYLAALLRMPMLAFTFYVWVGIFNVAIIAVFWSFANDIYSVERGERLFPMIAVGATAGAPLGSFLAGALFDAGVSAPSLMQLSAGLLVIHVLLYGLVLRRRDVVPGQTTEDEGADRSLFGGFALVVRDRYLILIACLLVLLNLVNTTGEYLLSVYAEGRADAALNAALAADASVDRKEFLGQFFGVFYGRFFFVVNVVGVVLQAFAVSRLVKYLGIAGVLFALPIVALGTYGWIAVGAGFAAFRWFKTAENATDYSVMNTAKAMLWLPTSHDEKYQAKFAADTFFVRFGDLLAGGLVYVGINWLAFLPENFAQANVIIIAVWFAVSAALLLEYRRRGTGSRSKTAIITD